jgi:hypothetical protein
MAASGMLALLAMAGPWARCCETISRGVEIDGLEEEEHLNDVI